MKQGQFNEDKEEGEEQTKPGRGRGKGKGRGGRGRGRGRGAADDDDANCKRDNSNKASSSKQKSKSAQPKKDDWAAWGTDDAWSQGWDDGWNREEWAWDSVAYWEKEIAAYELERQHELELEQQQQLEQNQTNQKAAKPSKETQKIQKSKEKDSEDKGSRKKKKDKHQEEPETVEQEELPKKKIRKDRAKKDKEEEQQKESTKEKAAKTKAKDQETDEGSKPKRRKRSEPKPDNDAIPDPVVNQAIAAKTNKVLDFLEGFKGMNSEDSLTLMRGRLGTVRNSRMNVYWTRASVGLHHKKQNVDFAHFKFSSDPNFGALPSHYLMAAALKAAEMVVTRHWWWGVLYGYNTPSVNKIWAMQPNPTFFYIYLHSHISWSLIFFITRKILQFSLFKCLTVRSNWKQYCLGCCFFGYAELYGNLHAVPRDNSSTRRRQVRRKRTSDRSRETKRWRTRWQPSRKPALMLLTFLLTSWSQKPDASCTMSCTNKAGLLCHIVGLAASHGVLGLQDAIILPRVDTHNVYSKTVLQVILPAQVWSLCVCVIYYSCMSNNITKLIQTSLMVNFQFASVVTSETKSIRLIWYDPPRLLRSAWKHFKIPWKATGCQWNPNPGAFLSLIFKHMLK